MTRMTDLIHNVKVVPVNSGTNTVADETIDTLGYYSALFIGLKDEVTITVVESDDSGMADETAVPASQIIEGTNILNVVPTKRYLKATVDDDTKVTCLLFGADVDGHINVEG